MNRKRIVSGTIFVIFGILFLLSETGHLGMTMLETFLKFWPIILVVWGVYMIIEALMHSMGFCSGKN